MDSDAKQEVTCPAEYHIPVEFQVIEEGWGEGLEEGRVSPCSVVLLACGVRSACVHRMQRSTQVWLAYQGHDALSMEHDGMSSGSEPGAAWDGPAHAGA